MLDGFFINGPLLHYAYEILEHFMPAGESVMAAVMQVDAVPFLTHSLSDRSASLP